MRPTCKPLIFFPLSEAVPPLLPPPTEGRRFCTVLAIALLKCGCVMERCDEKVWDGKVCDKKICDIMRWCVITRGCYERMYHWYL